MTPLKLLVTTDSIGGVWQYSVDLATALAGRGVEVVLAQMGPPPSAAQRAAASGIPGVELVETGLPLDWLCDAREPIEAAGRALSELARRHRVDLVQLNMPTLAAGASFDVPVITVSHGCVATWWQAARPEPLAERYRWHEAMMRAGYQRADAVVAPTRAYAGMVARHYALSNLPITVHNGRNAVPATRTEQPGDCAFTAGRLWDSVKQARLLDQVASRLAVPFHAAGAVRGPHGETIRLDHLHLLGELDEGTLGGWLAARPVFVSAARFEPFGLAVLEAAAAGCPLVLADIPTFRELWDGAALFVDPEDADGFQQSVERLVEDRTLAAARGEIARSRAERYRPEATADAMLTLYRRLAGARKAAA